MDPKPKEKPTITEHFTTSRSHPWWKEDIASELHDTTRDLLLNYSHIPSSNLIPHISSTRDKAWQIAPYASVGSLSWLNAAIATHFAYNQVLSVLLPTNPSPSNNDPPTLLDCGCMLAPDLRHLTSLGIPSHTLSGFDIEPAFFPLSKTFYNDASKFHANLIQADGIVPISSPSSSLRPWKDKFDMLWCRKFLHLFDRQTQIEVAANLVGLLKGAKGSMFLGSQNGAEDGASWELGVGTAVAGKGTGERGMRPFFASKGDWEDMWEEVGVRTGTRWDLRVEVVDLLEGRDAEELDTYAQRSRWNLQWAAVML